MITTIPRLNSFENAKGHYLHSNVKIIVEIYSFSGEIQKHFSNICNFEFFEIFRTFHSVVQICQIKMAPLVNLIEMRVF